MRLRRVGLVTIAASTLLLSGCTSVFGDIREAWKYATTSPEDVTLSAQEIADFPYTALYARRGEQARALIVLGYVDAGGASDSALEGGDPRLQWVSAQREVLETQSGRIVRTYKFEPDLLSIGNLENDPLVCIQHELERAGSVSTDVSGCSLSWDYTLETEAQGQRAMVAVRGEFSLDGSEVLTLADGQQETTLKLTEHVTTQPAPAGRFVGFGQVHAQSYANQYWLGSDGLVVKSYQYFVPGEPGVMLDSVKWVGRYE